MNHHAKEGYHRGIVRVVLLQKGRPRDRWLTRHMDDFAVMNEIYVEFFSDAPPARPTIEVTRLSTEALVEVEAIAIRTKE